MGGLNELSAEVLAPLLKGWGFGRRGRVFSRANEFGDLAFVQLMAHSIGVREVEFQVNLAFAPRSVTWWYFNRERPEDPGLSMWWERLRLPGINESLGPGDPGTEGPYWGGDNWKFNLGDAENVRIFTDTLEAELPYLVSLLDRETLKAELRGPRRWTNMFLRPDSTPELAVVLSDEGDSPELREVLARLDAGDEWRQSVATWVRDRLAGRVDPPGEG